MSLKTLITGAAVVASLATLTTAGATDTACPTGVYQPYPDDMPAATCTGTAANNAFFGKGRADAEAIQPRRHGVLRHSLPHWLAAPPLAGRVLQVASAHQKHGGGGAFYVYLRRPTQG